MSTRAPLAYLGGVRVVRWVGRLGSALCLGGCAVLAWRLARHEQPHVAALVAIYVSGILLAFAVRVLALRWVLASRDGWSLVAIVGRAKAMPRIVRAYRRGEDVVAVAADGSTIVLGVDRFPFRDAEVVRRKLLAELPVRSRLWARTGS